MNPLPILLVGAGAAALLYAFSQAGGDAPGERAARWALRFLKLPPLPTAWRHDCVGLVELIYKRVGIPLTIGVAPLWRRAEALGATHTRPRPSIGDVVFFDKTTTKETPLSHVGIVVDVAPDGTITFVHTGDGHRITAKKMNLLRPDDRNANGIIRPRRDSDPPGTKYRTSELFRGFATIQAADKDRWA